MENTNTVMVVTVSRYEGREHSKDVLQITCLPIDIWTQGPHQPIGGEGCFGWTNHRQGMRTDNQSQGKDDWRTVHTGATQPILGSVLNKQRQFWLLYGMEETKL